uniref:Uncharacterized protein n=1 Tax=Cacopsylla melanoneura TaxID=428564 RepID=A0A8D9F7W4_9HEMI
MQPAINHSLVTSDFDTQHRNISSFINLAKYFLPVPYRFLLFFLFLFFFKVSLFFFIVCKCRNVALLYVLHVCSVYKNNLKKHGEKCVCEYLLGPTLILDSPVLLEQLLTAQECGAFLRCRYVH